jgi:DNA-binding CsgD family transcriptional regulator
MESELRHMQLLEEKSGYQANDLTGREQEIMQFLARGCSYAIIAEKLFISKNTVKYHIKNIYLKLDVKNRVEATKNKSPAIKTVLNTPFMILRAILTNFKFRFLCAIIGRTSVIQKDSIYFYTS